MSACFLAAACLTLISADCLCMVLPLVLSVSLLQESCHFLMPRPSVSVVCTPCTAAAAAGIRVSVLLAPCTAAAV